MISRTSKSKKALLTDILTQLTTATILVDKGLKVTYLNLAAEKLLGISASKAIGRGLPSAFLANDAMVFAFERALSIRESFVQREAELIFQGHNRFVDFSVSALENTDDLLIEIHDIDRLYRISQEEHAINAYHSSRKIIRGIAHEIKTPLMGIRGAAQLLEREFDDNSGERELTDIMIAEADRLRGLADQMLGSNKLVERRWVNVHEAIERVSQLLKLDNETIHYRKDYDPSLPEIWGNLDQLIQVFLNIARNAQQALLENGFYEHSDVRYPQITLKTRCKHQFTIGNDSHRSVMSIEIHDNGIGIADNIKESLFYPLVTGRAEGTGLGLSIAQDIISQHQGLIVFSSKPGKTIFTVNIPFAEND